MAWAMTRWASSGHSPLGRQMRRCSPRYLVRGLTRVPLAEQGLDQELLAVIRLVIGRYQGAQGMILDLVEPADVEGRVGPGALGDQADDRGHAGASLQQDDIPGAQ